MDQLERLDQLCVNTIRTLCIDAVQNAKSGHPGAPMGMAPAAFALWDRFLRHDPAWPEFPNRDRFVLSMGHASMLLYALLHLTGYDVALDDVRSFRQLHGRCAGHPESTLIGGVETTTGPLGQGVGNSVGMAIAERWLAARFNQPGHTIVDYHVYALCSDGDLMEGVGAESASLAGHLALSNLIWIYDNNGITIDGSTEITFSENVARRFQAYGWYVQTVADANNLDELTAAIEAANNESRRPSLIMVQSVIGYGSPNRAGTPKAHGEPLGEREAQLAKEAYGWPLDQPFHVPDEVYVHLRDRALRRGAQSSSEWRAAFESYAAEHPELAREWNQMQAGQVPDDWDADLPTFEPDPKGIATRVADSKVLAAVARKVPWMLGGSADLVASTKTIVPDSGLFQPDEPDGRNLAFGVREHAMAAVMNGLALSKIRPFGSSFLTFTDYCRPSVRLAALSELPCIYLFTHDSVGVGEDGPTHQPIEHLASLRAMPNLDVIRPCDANEVAVAWRHVMRLTDRPALMALTRQTVPTLDRSRYASADGLLQGGYVLSDCDGTPDVILIGTGSEVQHCLEATERLAGDGIDARVVSMPCWELFEQQSQEYRDSVLPPLVKARVSIEAGSTMGWSCYVGDAGVAIGIDRYGLSAPADEVMKELGITADAVVAAARHVVARLKGSIAEDGSGERLDDGTDKSSEASLNTNKTRIHQISESGQAIWCDSISRAMIESGELARLIDVGVVGVTSNPTIFQKAISQGADYDDLIASQVAGGKSVEEIYESIAIGDVGDAADILRPVYDRTGGRDGFVSLEVNPHLAHDTDGTVGEARRLFERLARPNVFIKVPATPAGIPAIETLIAEGINVNVTLIFALAMYDQVMEAYLRGVEQLLQKGGDASRVASVASFFVSRVDSLVDKKLEKSIADGNKGLERLLGKAAVGNAKLAYQRYKSVFGTANFARLSARGAVVQRPLWASTSTKNPKYADTLYVDPLIGRDTVNTLPPQTIEAVLDHGECNDSIEHDVDSYRQVMADIEAAGILMDEVTDELLEAGVKAFADSFDLLTNELRAKISTFQTA